MQTTTDKTKTPHPMAALQQAKKQRDARTRKENKERDSVITTHFADPDEVR